MVTQAEEVAGGVRVLLKAGAILEELKRRGELSAAELAEALDEPRATIYRLVRTLQHLELVEPGARRGLYRLGFGVVRLAQACVNQLDERHAALPVLERLRNETGETVFLAVRRDLSAVCIERLGGYRVQSLALSLGGSLPLHAGAVSRVLLAHEDRSVLNRLIAQRLERFTEFTISSAPELVADAELTRQRGFAVSDQDVTIGISAIGAPIVDYTGKIRAALSISGVRPAIIGDRTDELTALAVAAGEEISRSLGYRARN